MLDKQGKIFGKISLLDALIILAVIVLAAGFIYNRTARDIRQIIQADTPIYVTFRIEGVREFSLSAVQEGDIFFRQHERIALGTVSDIEILPAYSIAAASDGTAVYAPVVGRYDMLITLQTLGSITDNGYFVNGTQQMSVGGRMILQSNMFFGDAAVYGVRG